MLVFLSCVGLSPVNLILQALSTSHGAQPKGDVGSSRKQNPHHLLC